MNRKINISNGLKRIIAERLKNISRSLLRMLFILLVKIFCFARFSALSNLDAVPFEEMVLLPSYPV
jgi:hypothetical protein